MQTQRLPATFGSYELLELIATGGTSEIFKARLRSPTEALPGLLVVKRIYDHLAADERFARVFAAQAGAARRVRHAIVVPVHEVGETFEAGVSVRRCFLSRGYVAGLSLRAVLDRARLAGERVPMSIARQIVLRICGALHQAHEMTGTDGRPLGLVHGDVSPSNILLSYEGGVALTNFCTWKAAMGLDAAPPDVYADRVAYMSPEQAAGLPIDRRSDVFAVGAVFFEILTGLPLFDLDAPIASVLKSVREAMVVLPSKVDGRLPPELDALMAKMLARDPADRIGSAMEIATALRENAAIWPEEILFDRIDMQREENIELQIIEYMRRLFRTEMAQTAEGDAAWRRDGSGVDGRKHWAKLSLGDVLGGHYRINRLAGQDGLERFYEATDTRFDEGVVVEVIPNAVSADVIGQASYIETVRKIRKARLSRVLVPADYAAIDDAWVVVWRCPRWRTLGEGTAAARPVRQLRDAARAVAELHSIGLVHGDIKPGSVIVEEDGSLRLARFILTVQAGTTSSHVFGTPQYMAPEAFRLGEPIAPARDVYALGILGCVLATGKTPFDRLPDFRAVMLRKLESRDVTAHDIFGSDYDELVVDPFPEKNHLIGVLDRALKADPHERYVDAQALVDALGPDEEPGARVEPYVGDEAYVFLSYSRRDATHARAVIATLAASGIRVWFDAGILAGKDWAAEIQTRLKKCAVFVLLISPRSVDSENVLDEINLARNGKKPMLGIVVEETPLEHGLELRLSRFQMIEVARHDLALQVAKAFP